jgi:RimJ/RimL family protein N-acetyltransferase
VSGAEGPPPDQIDAPPFVLQRHRAEDAPAMITAINESLEHLRPWMDWAQKPATEASIGEFLASARLSFAEGTDYGYVVRESSEGGKGAVLGGCGLHRRGGPGVIEIGYWVHAAHVRRGIARAASVALRDQAFAIGIDRVEIHCDERNVASAAVARSAGFSLAGIVPRTARTAKGSAREMIWFAWRADR